MLRVAFLAHPHQGSARECSWCLRRVASQVRATPLGAGHQHRGTTAEVVVPRSAARAGAAPRPNPSVNARPNGLAPGPRGRVVHLRPRGPGANPSVPRYLER